MLEHDRMDIVHLEERLALPADASQDAGLGDLEMLALLYRAMPLMSPIAA